jgi:hypothetical protein
MGSKSEGANMTVKYHAHIPRTQVSDQYHTVRYDTAIHTLMFQTSTIQEARVLVFMLNECASIEARNKTAEAKQS